MNNSDGINRSIYYRATLLVAAMIVITAASAQLKADTGSCGNGSTSLPFTDVPAGNVFFCSIAEAYFSALTNGTTATTYNPSDTVTREQMAAFITRTMDQSLQRGSRRAALKEFWTPISRNGLGFTNVGIAPALVVSDGADIWVPNETSGTVSRVRGSDGKLLETWTGASSAVGALSATGKIFVTGTTNPGRLYEIDPYQPAGAVSVLTSALGAFPQGIAFDGERIWTAGGSSVSIVSFNPLSVTVLTAGFDNPRGLVYDGVNMWVTNQGTDKLFKLDSNGLIIQAIDVGQTPGFPVFDGTNIWVPSALSDTVTVVRASTGAVLAILKTAGLNGSLVAAFDGERVLVTNPTGNSVFLWKAADLTPLGSVNTGPNTRPFGACSDGLNFWIALAFSNQLARF